MKIYFIFILLVCSFLSCKEEVLPKPTGQLRLDYPEAEYTRFEKNSPYSFSVNSETIIKQKSMGNFEIHYPKMKATLYLSYKPVHGNLNLLLKDAQKLTFDHVIKADEILEHPFENRKDRVYGMFYEVEGNAATNGQFYATDSIKHFLDCSVYFYAKPNFDSIMPAASYIKNDMQHLMETLKWK